LARSGQADIVSRALRVARGMLPDHFC
jgi:hypothetical protein